MTHKSFLTFFGIVPPFGLRTGCLRARGGGPQFFSRWFLGWWGFIIIFSVWEVLEEGLFLMFFFFLLQRLPFYMQDQPPVPELLLQLPHQPPRLRLHRGPRASVPHGVGREPRGASSPSASEGGGQGGGCLPAAAVFRNQPLCLRGVTRHAGIQPSPPLFL